MIQRVIVGFALALWTVPVSAQVAFDTAAGGATSVTATSQTLAYTMSASTGGCLLIGSLGDATSDVLTGATFNGVSATLVDKQNANPGAVYWQYLWALAAPASGTHNIIISASTTTHIQVIAASYTGVDATGCAAVSAKTSGGTDPYVATVTTTTAANWTAELINASVGVVASTNFTGRADDGGATYYLADSNAAQPVGANAMSVTGGGGTKQSIIAAIAPPGVAGGSLSLLGVGR